LAAALLDEQIDDMRADKPSSTCRQNPLPFEVGHLTRPPSLSDAFLKCTGWVGYKGFAKYSFLQLLHHRHYLIGLERRINRRDRN